MSTCTNVKIFESNNTDENPLDAVDSKCHVLHWDERSKADPTDEDVFFCRMSYNSKTRKFMPVKKPALKPERSK